MTFLITGANRGIGLEFVTQLLAFGNKVIAWASKAETSQSLLDLQTKHSHQLVVDFVDVASFEQVTRAAQKVQELDVLINNAGVLLDDKDTIETLSPKVLASTFQTNLYAPVFVTQKLFAGDRSQYAAAGYQYVDPDGLYL